MPQPTGPAPHRRIYDHDLIVRSYRGGVPAIRIAAEIGCALKTVYDALDQAEVPRQRPQPAYRNATMRDLKEIARAAAAYEERAEIARRLGFHPHTVTKLVRRHNIVTPPDFLARIARRNRRKDPRAWSLADLAIFEALYAVRASYRAIVGVLANRTMESLKQHRRVHGIPKRTRGPLDDSGIPEIVEAARAAAVLRERGHRVVCLGRDVERKAMWSVDGTAPLTNRQVIGRAAWAGKKHAA